MIAKIEVRMDNAAFEDSPVGELGRILAKLARDIEDGSETLGCTLVDANGNAVGQFRLIQD